MPENKLVISAALKENIIKLADTPMPTLTPTSNSKVSEGITQNISREGMTFKISTPIETMHEEFPLLWAHLIETIRHNTKNFTVDRLLHIQVLVFDPLQNKWATIDYFKGNE